MYRWLALFLMIAVIACLPGCIVSDTHSTDHYSGRYEPQDDDQPFVPPGLSLVPATRPAMRRIVIAELGESDLPVSGMIKSFGTAKSAVQEVVALDSVPFKSPPSRGLQKAIGELAALALEDDKGKSSATTQPSKHDRAMAIITEAALTHYDWERLSAEYEAELARQLRDQPAAEIKRLCELARGQHADGLVLLTLCNQVSGAEGSALGLLNLLIVPTFVIPTESFTGEISAAGWLIDPTDGRVLATVRWNERTRHWTQYWFAEGNHKRLMRDQREAAVREVAKKLLD